MRQSGKQSAPGVTERLLKAMARVDFYPECPGGVERRETHISWVFIAGESVFKLKKPIKFDFVDYSSLERRFRMCREEVRLNRRLAAGVYLGVVPIVMRGGGFAIAPSCDGPIVDAVEYAVWMRRLSDERSLETLLRRGEVSSADLGRIAEVIAGFHRQAARARALQYGAAAAIEHGIMGNLAECAAAVGDTVSQAEFAELTQLNGRFIERHRDTFDHRARAGRVCEGHGDLRCEHIHLAADGYPTIIDCVEFNERLRYADVASDLAFLLMDMERLGAARQAHALFEAYLHASGDGQLAELLNFYKCYRATVRAKVADLKSRQEIPHAERERAREAALKQFRAAIGYARLCGPVLIMLYGLSGSGKSTVAQLLARRLGVAHYNSDVLRKEMFVAGSAATGAADYRKGIYGAEQTRATYDALLAAAGKELELGRGVIVDASFKEHGERLRIVELARAAGVPLVMAECVAPESEIRRRLVARSQQPGAISDATWDTYLLQKTEFAPSASEMSRHHILVNTEQTPLEGALVIEQTIANGGERLRPA